ncbi:chitin synthase activator [Colletotrichum karsti]|uniref:Chitin synthase activator n=1 Tax=Colletotrichum karsti TaxID=1095194 RepID=A0A9P6LK80_9PEZI|nr:chitin synthase activator [Colletotrichum karsti]KAF9879089.1 chitin synthase activator [Colletotrichum karsti]
MSPERLTMGDDGRKGSARIRDAPASPVRVNFQAENWAQPSNANIEMAQPYHGEFSTVDSHSQNAPLPPKHSHQPGRQLHSRDGKQLPPLATSNSYTAEPERLSPANSRPPTQGNNDSIYRAKRGTQESDSFSIPRSQDTNRQSRESDTTASTTQHQASTESSATTSASSVSGNNESSDYKEDDSPTSSVVEGNMSGNQSVPMFQYYHHQEYPPQRVASVPQELDRRSSSNPSLNADGTPVNRHLTPTGFTRRSSMPRPSSAYSAISDYAPRGRSPNLMPGGAQMRTPSGTRKSPETRPASASYAELLNVPYPQPAPAPINFDNNQLRNAVGNNASLLSTQKTLEMYRQNVKKTNDFSIQYSFAVFLISTAQDQGLDPSAPAPRKGNTSPQHGPSSPHELLKEAKGILTKLANNGYPFAQYYVADGYASGLFSKGKEDYNQAFPLFVQAAKHGHAESAYRAALCYEFGWGCRKDPAKAVQYLRMSASKRHPGAMSRLGKACLSGDLGEKRYREGIKWMKLAAEAADSVYSAAPYQLGCLYETGYGDDIFRDESYAAELFTAAAELGHPEANFRMGEAYEHGKLNCPRDPALSVHFYTGAAERGHAGAMMGLCAWYMVGAEPILEKDEEEAYEWARRSAELGYVKAQYAVGYFTEMGIGCRRDILEANVWYVKAADAGDERAKQRLAIIQAAVSGGTPMEVAPPRNGKIKKNADDKDCIVM